MPRIIAITIALVLVWAAPCAAHPGFPASAIIHVENDGLMTVHVRHDALAFALDETPVRIADEPMRRLLAAPREEKLAVLDAAADRFKSLFKVQSNGQALEVEVIERPTVQSIEAGRREAEALRLPIMLEFVARATLPPGATSFSLTFPEVLGDVIVVVERPGMEPLSWPLRAGEPSPEFALAAPADAGHAHAEPSGQTSEISAVEVAWRYLQLGLTHIIPYGLDHMLFVLGLYFLSKRMGALLMQVTAFTIAHSVTLTLATLGIARLPATIVEPIIAASIALVAVENILTSRVHPWRPFVVFLFGLVHGMGFAGALQDLGLPRGRLAAALVSFNVGVELGQLSVIALAFLVLGWWRAKPWYRRAIAVPASALIAAIGLWWTVQRVMGW